MKITYTDIPGVNAYNIYEEPMSKNEKQAQAGGPNPDYIPHQLIPGPKQHAHVTDIMVAYVNYLEERVTVFEREMVASHERVYIAENIENEQMKDIGKRNTELEVENRELRKVIAEKGYRLSQWAVHPWDMPCGRTPKNPEGLTANQLFDRQQARINELVDLIEQQSMVRGVPAAPPQTAPLHPWDQKVDPDQDNPLGLTAREVVRNYRDVIATQREQIRRLKDETVKLDELSMNNYVQNAGIWTFDTFGGDVFHSIHERAARLFEESAEVAQKAGVSEVMQHTIVGRVNARKHGRMDQELGGVIMCWAAMVAALDMRPDAIMSRAIQDCWARQQEIRLRQRAKIDSGMSHVAVSTVSYASEKPSPDVVIAEGRDNLKAFVDATRSGIDHGAT